MSVDNLPDQLQRADMGESGAILNVPGKGFMFAWGTIVPTDGTEGYAPGCIFLDLDANGEEVFYVNQGTSASCSFKGFETALEAALAATTNGNGASKVGIEDAAGLLTAENVETALAELRNRKGIVIDAKGSSETPTPVTLAQLKGGVIFAAGDAAQYLVLATPAAEDAGLTVTIMRTVHASAVTISTAGAEQINGSDTHNTCDAIYDHITIMWTGAQWRILTSEIAA
jgi:hypothetical protein